MARISVASGWPSCAGFPAHALAGTARVAAAQSQRNRKRSALRSTLTVTPRELWQGARSWEAVVVLHRRLLAPINKQKPWPGNRQASIFQFRDI